MEQIRMVQTPRGMVTYILRKKRIKNLNLRLERSGQVAVSVPLSCSAQRADRFVAEKAEWIFASLARRQERSGLALPPEPDRGECLRELQAALNRVYPLVQPLGVDYPRLKLRKMTSQWGNCHWQQGYITLNTALCRCPEPLRDYVALHELVHFLAPNHGPQFYAWMDRLMPDWRARRRTLKGYANALGPADP